MLAKTLLIGKLLVQACELKLDESTGLNAELVQTDWRMAK